MQVKPVLFVDIHGVVSHGGMGSNARPAGALHSVDAIMRFLSCAAAIHLLALHERFDLVGCSGGEEKAEEYLPRLLALPRGLSFLSFARNRGRATLTANDAVTAAP